MLILILFYFFTNKILLKIFDLCNNTIGPFLLFSLCRNVYVPVRWAWIVVMLSEERETGSAVTENLAAFLLDMLSSACGTETTISLKNIFINANSCNERSELRRNTNCALQLQTECLNSKLDIPNSLNLGFDSRPDDLISWLKFPWFSSILLVNAGGGGG